MSTATKLQDARDDVRVDAVLGLESMAYLFTLTSFTPLPVGDMRLHIATLRRTLDEMTTALDAVEREQGR